MLVPMAVLVVCTVQGLQLDSQASTRKPRVTKYSKTTAMPGGSTVSIFLGSQCYLATANGKVGKGNMET